MADLFPALMIFLAVVFALASLYSLVSDLWLADRERVQSRMEAEFCKVRRERVEQSSLFKDLSRLSADPAVQTEAPPTFDKRIALWMEQAGLSYTPRQLLNAMLGVGVGTALLCVCIQPHILVGLCAIVVGAALPAIYVGWLHARRRNRLLTQLPEAFETMARVLRAGHTLPEGVKAVGRECALPLGEEFAYCFEQQNLGLPPETAFQDLARRTGLPELRLFALVALVQQQTGGNMAEVFDNLAGTVRARLRNQRRTQTLTAESRLQAHVLLAIPPVLFFIMLILRRDYAQALLDTPQLLWLTFGLQVIGLLWIRKIVNIDP